ncbi:LPS-assembly protein LptD [Piscinibacter terrae]|uniref:LPS-assembly protein LptD n=1 Tax=Piscinibacter terrae TaxID=2496871 RepID=A0A3N7IU59_9BURK|nr:LPS assembly protein LptD [Albitalea terrae]RQP22372.1 LPS-assembly protein LptD [Albitalea terrae]
MPPDRLAPVAAALALMGAGTAAAQDAGIQLQISPTLAAPSRGDASRKLPIVLQAKELRGRPDLETVAEGDAEFRRGGMVIRADRLAYDNADDLATARGNVRVSRDGNIYSGPELQLHVQRFEGFFLQPTYFFSRTGAGGSAQRIDFLDDQRAVATAATYTSCPTDGSGDPAWLLSTSKVKMDFEANEGIAEGAVLRFMGVPILGAPVLSFPLTDARKSGWLPPNIYPLDSKSGFVMSVPYYWNIAPNRDATITPGFATKRGVSLGTELRYLEPHYNGNLNLDLMPNDKLTGKSRYAVTFSHDAALIGNTNLAVRALRVSDDDYWKDFPRNLNTITPRLLLSDVQASKPLGEWTTYARAMQWQVLQNTDAPITEAPYQRLPQIGARTLQRLGGGLELGFEGEFNRFVNPDGTLAADLSRPTGVRAHTLASIARPWLTPGWSFTPKLSLNAAAYSLDQPMSDGRRTASRIIPTLSVDSAWVFERDTRWFGREVRQTLEPRLLYVNTPFRDQTLLPNFDSAGKDFNFETIYTENAFSGVDRVSDAHQLTAGVTTRLLEPDTGAEAVRLGVVQRFLFRDQRITPEGTPFTQRFSDILLLGSSNLIPRWHLDGTVQYNPDTHSAVRSIVSARYSPGPYRTINATYRLARGLSEQVELGWQWPLYGPLPAGVDDSPAPAKELRVTGGSGSCKGTMYAVGRVNYSTRDSRVTDAVVGLEYDAGCWIGRLVAERLSTGRSEATTRLLWQLELVGLSRLGSNPLQVLKDNIPGYRLLRDGTSAPATNSFYD